MPKGPDISVERASASARVLDVSVDRAVGSIRTQDFPNNPGGTGSAASFLYRGAELNTKPDDRVVDRPVRLGRLSRGSKVFGVEVLSDASCPACGGRKLECYLVTEPTPGTALSANQGFSQRYREQFWPIVVACDACGIEGKGSDINEAIERFRKAGGDPAPSRGPVPGATAEPPDVLEREGQLYIKERRETPEDDDDAEFLQDRIRYLQGVERDQTNKISDLEYKIEERETDVQDLENKIEGLNITVRYRENQIRYLENKVQGLESIARDLQWLEEPASPVPSSSPSSGMTQGTGTAVPILDPPYVVDGLDASSGLGTVASFSPAVDVDSKPDVRVFRGKSFRRKP